MLIQFNFDNFRSFRDEVSLDLSATRFSEHPKHISVIGRERILPVAGIFGANASGKSNVLNAFGFMAKYVQESFGYGGMDSVLHPERFSRVKGRIPFLFSDSDTTQLGSTFEVFYTDPMDTKDRVWNYGFVLNSKGVEEEWLNTRAKTASKSAAAKLIFHREGNELAMPGVKRIHHGALRTALNDETLLVSLGSKLRVDDLKAVADWFQSAIISTDFADPVENLVLSSQLPANIAESADVRHGIVKYLRAFDSSIVGLEAEPANDEKTLLSVNTLHKMPSGKNVRLPLGEEAAGTLKMLSLYPWVQATMESGGVLLVDELNSKLHPLLVRNFILLFLDTERNPKHAQLIFTSHDTWLLDADLLRRDEIWYTEKDEHGASTLYSLAEFSDEQGGKIRKDASLSRNYLLGKYGGVPDLQPIQVQGTT